MIVEVELCGLGEEPPSPVRKVLIPDENISPELTTPALLEMVFHAGQNDIQPQERVRSVSVGDIIRYNGKRYTVDSVGFKEIK